MNTPSGNNTGFQLWDGVIVKVKSKMPVSAQHIAMRRLPNCRTSCTVHNLECVIPFHKVDGRKGALVNHQYMYRDLYVTVYWSTWHCKRKDRKPSTNPYINASKEILRFIDSAILEMFCNSGAPMWLNFGLILAFSTSPSLSLPTHNWNAVLIPHGVFIAIDISSQFVDVATYFTNALKSFHQHLNHMCKFTTITEHTLRIHFW